ncbi:MAG: WYL domain-containing protein [Sandaracinaceae bacterium]|nr:WYL domain-containing protein [Sandaracinaceae bacterium]
MRLLDDALAARGLSAGQLTALVLARATLAPLEGTELVSVLDGLIADRRTQRTTVRALPEPLPKSPRIVRLLETALDDRRRVRVLYRSARDADWRWRAVDPGALQLRSGVLYLWAFALERDDWRTYKVSRIRDVDVLEVPAVQHPGLADIVALPHAVRVWTGSTERVEVWIHPAVAWLVAEYPLVADQKVAVDDDGAAIVKATVAGLVEAQRWVLRWGRHAVVRAPAALREAVVEELRAALGAYRPDG